MKPNIGLNDKTRKAVADMLAATLADEFVLYVQTRNCHWNVTGIHFQPLHTFFEGQYKQLDDVIDDTAERIRQLGHSAPATLHEYLKLTRLKEQPGKYPTAEVMLNDLAAAHEKIIRQLRSDIETCNKLGDAGNTDYLTGLMQTHEKMAWMLRSFVKVA